MSDKEKTEESTEKAEANSNELKLNSLFAFKVGMSTVFDDDGSAINVTLLKYEPMAISQIKTKENDGYSALQVAFKPKRKTRTNNSELVHLNKAGFENGAYFKREVRQDVPDGAEVGKKVSLESFVKGDTVRITGVSKGHGFSGVMKRFKHKGGPATHGSGFHRRPGSIGNREFPGRVMAGKRMPGHFGCDTTTTINVSVVDVITEENVLLVKGPVPGARNSLVQLTKMRA